MQAAKWRVDDKLVFLIKTGNIPLFSNIRFSTEYINIYISKSQQRKSLVPSAGWLYSSKVHVPICPNDFSATNLFNRI